jgi:hypothetical protein
MPLNAEAYACVEELLRSNEAVRRLFCAAINDPRILQQMRDALAARLEADRQEAERKHRTVWQRVRAWWQRS